MKVLCKNEYHCFSHSFILDFSLLSGNDIKPLGDFFSLSPFNFDQRSHYSPQMSSFAQCGFPSFIGELEITSIFKFT